MVFYNKTNPIHFALNMAVFCHRGQYIYVLLCLEIHKKFKEAFKRFASLEVQSNILECPYGAVACPHLFKKIAIIDICTG